MDKKIISFSLYGTDEKYWQGALRNTELQQEFYPDWICRFYVSQEIHQDIIKQLSNAGAEIVKKTRKDFSDGMFWRFLPASDPDMDILIVRDTDSRLGLRERLAVNEWLESGKNFHIMRDHPQHGTLILGGMWGCKKNVIPYMLGLVALWDKFEQIGRDQNFLAQKIYPRIRNSCLIHSDLICYEDEKTFPFPSQRKNFEFVGKPFNGNELIHNEAVHTFDDTTKKVLPSSKSQVKKALVKSFIKIEDFMAKKITEKVL